MNEREITVLVIEDEFFSQKLLTTLLVKQGYRVVTADDGEDGRVAAAKEHPDIILLDVNMPGDDGFTTCEKLKANPITRDIPIIFISGNADTQSKVTGLSIGGADYITKPFQKAEVEARVRNCLKLRFAYQQIIKEQSMRLQQMHDAQQAILVNPDEVPEARFAVRYLPVLEAGGDFYDVFPIAQGIHGYLVSDISGHDISASFATSALKALVRQNTSILHTPDETVRMINQILTSLYKDGQHLTAIYAIVNRSHNILATVNAGHLPLLLMPQDVEPYWVEANSDILGAFEDAMFVSQVIHVNPGDRFFMFSDGLVESFEEPTRTRSEGMDLLLQVAKQGRSLSISEATDEVFAAFSQPGQAFEDDVLLMGVDI